MIRRNTWILLILLVVVIGAAFYFNHLKQTGVIAGTPTVAPQTFLFSSKDGNPTDIKIADNSGRTVEIARDSTGSWVVKAPTATAANQSQAEAAATQLTSLKMLANVQIGLADVGLDKPTYTMTVTFGNTKGSTSSAKTHKVLIGSVNPIQTGYYVQVDGGPIQVADKSGIDSLTGMLTAPPYLATMTPTITPTTIPTDTLTPTPAPTDTPTMVSTTMPVPSSTPTP